MNTNNLSLGLIIATVALLILAVATPYWDCGNILANCDRYNAFIVAKVFFMLGLVCCIVVLILEIIGIVSLIYRANATLTLVKLILLGIGIGSLIICILVYTSTTRQSWSYLCTIVGVTLGMQALIIGFMTSSCTLTTRSTSGHVVVRHTVVSH